MPINIQSRYRGNSDVSMRHSDTVVGYINFDGTVTPYIVRGVDGPQQDPTLMLRKMSDEHQGESGKMVSLNDPLLISDRPDCGFANLSWLNKDYAVFYSTRALRQYKRSLSMNQLRTTTIGSSRCSLSISNSDSRAKAAYSFFNDTFPTVSEALRTLRAGDGYSVAFSDKFALCLHRTKGIILFYKEEVVGWVGEGDELALVPSKIHLQEQLDEVK